MSHSRGRSKAQQSYSGYREAPNSSAYYGAQQDAYYPQDYTYRPGYSAYSSSDQQPQEYSRVAPYAYYDARSYHDQHSWNREEERGTHRYEDDYSYSPTPSSQNASRNYGHEYDYDRHLYPDRRYDYASYSDYSSHGRDPANSYSGYADYRQVPEQAYSDTRGYSDYRRPEPEHEERSTYHRPASPPHSRGFASQARAPVNSYPRRSPSSVRAPLPSPPPRHTEPREEYLAVSLQPSPHVDDPATARKLIVLDLNGSLLLRSAHQRRTPQPTRGKADAPFDPYADPTQPRPLRTVHRRPYLTPFASYIFHPETKKWLDTMVWSSAQPHSVADMVEQCFGARKSELKAVWARDTLGLSQNDYHKKSVTLKDLEKPWTELSFQLHDSSAASGMPSSPKPTASRAIKHSACTTFLVDDSPAKAALQPWNHLVIKEYLQATRNLDLIVADWESSLPKYRNNEQANFEATQPSPPDADQPNDQPEVLELTSSASSPPTSGADGEKNQPPAASASTSGNEKPAASEPVMRRVIREVVMINGEMVEPNETVVEDKIVYDMTAGDPAPFVPNQKRKQKRLAKKESTRLAREEKEREAYEALRAHQAEQERMRRQQMNGGNPLPDAADSNAQDHVVERSSSHAALRYDETLLAVVGVLDHVKHEGNVAGWMRSGGLITAALPADQQPTAPSAPVSPAQQDKGTKHSAPSRSQSPAVAALPTKRRKLSTGSEGEIADEATPPPSSQLTESAAEEQAATGVPLSAPIPASNKSAEAPAAGLWYEDPVVLNYWAGRGRAALKDLGIPIESGMVAIPGGFRGTKPSGA